MPPLSHHAPFTAGSIPRVRLPHASIRNEEDNKVVGEAARENWLPDTPLFAGWCRYPRNSLHWAELDALVDRANRDPAESVRAELRRVKTTSRRSQAVLTRYVQMGKGAYKIPDFIPTDRYFTQRRRLDAEFLAATHQYLFEGAGDDGAVDLIIRDAHFAGGPYMYFDDGNDRHEHRDRVQHRFETAVMDRHAVIMTWPDFELYRSAASYIGLFRNSNNVVGDYQNGVHADLNDFPPTARVMPARLFSANEGVPAGLSMPSLISVRYYAQPLVQLRDMHASQLNVNDRRTINRLDRMIGQEVAWALVHCWALERFWNKRVPKLPRQLIKLIENHIPDELLDTPLPAYGWGTAGRAILDYTSAAA